MTQQLAEGHRAELRRQAGHSHRAASARPARRFFAPVIRLRAPGATRTLGTSVLATG